MKIERNIIPTITLEELADKYGLVLEVNEREPRLIRMGHIGPGGRYYASFQHVDEIDGCFLRSSFGDGATEEEAIESYGDEISDKRLVLNAMRPKKRVEFGPYHIARKNQ